MVTFLALLATLTSALAVKVQSPAASTAAYPLQDGIPVTSSVSQFEFKYYSFTAYNQPVFEFILTSLGSNGQSVQLYVGNGYEPTLQNYLYKNTSSATTKVIQVAADGETQYIAGVYGFTADSYAIEASSSVPEISPNVQYKGSVDKTFWKYYQFYCPQNVADMVLVNSQTSNDADIYLSIGELPTTSTYGWKNTASSGTNCITITYPESGAYYVGMYGYGSTPNNYILQLKYNSNKQCSLVGTTANMTETELEDKPIQLVLKEVDFWP